MKKAMTRVMSAFALIAATGFAAPAFADDMQGKWEIKVMGTAVLPDGKITKVDKDTIGLPVGTQTSASDNYVPTASIEYYFTPSISVETICCVSQHHVNGTTGLPGAELVSDAKLIPATFTLKYHADLGGGISPYVGAGPAYFIFFGENPGASTGPLGITKVSLSDRVGVALQAGVDVPLNHKGLLFSLDAKRYFIGTTASFYQGSTLALQTEHKLDPWLLSAGLGYRF